MNAVATVLKAFFADLTDPLVPLSLYDELIEASGNENFNYFMTIFTGSSIGIDPSISKL